MRVVKANVDLFAKQHEPIMLKQFDTTSLELNLFENSLPFELENTFGYSALMRLRNSDKLLEQTTNFTSNDNVLTIKLNDYFLRISGSHTLDIIIKNEFGERTSNFNLNVIVGVSTANFFSERDMLSFFETLIIFKEKSNLLLERLEKLFNLAQEQREQIFDESQAEKQVIFNNLMIDFKNQYSDLKAEQETFLNDFMRRMNHFEFELYEMLNRVDEATFILERFPIDGGTFFEEYASFERDGGTF